MNNDLSPTLPADRPLLPNQHHEANIDIPSSSQSPVPERQQNGSTSSQGPSLSPSAKEGLSKKLQFLMHLSLNLDTLVYAELCVLYYMEYALPRCLRFLSGPPLSPPSEHMQNVNNMLCSCSFFRLFIRWMAQTLFVSPKTEDTVLIVPNYHVSAVVAPNLLCMFLHLISLPLEAGEASRGYIHGGILIDFIGQKVPSSRFTLILLDAVVLAIQCFMITVNIEKERIRNVIRPLRVNANSRVNVGASVTGQDHDSEERGVSRDAPETDQVNETDNVEMRHLGNNSDDGVSDIEPAGGEGSRLFRQSGAQRNNQFEGLADVLRSGNAVIGNFCIPQSLRNAWHSRENTPESAATYALQNVGYNATLAALAAQRRARLTATQQRQP
ncbi:hypothetical protein GQX73_g3363 [Xylaria multiplex]|uniref:DUF1746 domain-containing protein n=1 Tax=Xylaria multiplex TaxID=323545 RepID=A0A7C8IUC0_9PEZI|nr:hypothetical protein GQX73_g3363 [Xylaria multiplex]